MRHARASVIADQGITALQFVGQLCPANGRRMVEVLEHHVGVSGSAAMVSDYTRADLAQSAGALIRGARSALRSGTHLRVPSALIVRADDLPLWRHYCQGVGAFGALRAAFVTEQAARAWAAEHAALYAAQLRFRGRG